MSFYNSTKHSNTPSKEEKCTHSKQEFASTDADVYDLDELVGADVWKEDLRADFCLPPFLPRPPHPRSPRRKQTIVSKFIFIISYAHHMN